MWKKNSFRLGYINPFCFLCRKKNQKTLFWNILETFNPFFFFFKLLLDRRFLRWRFLSSIVSLASDLFATRLCCLIIDHLQPVKLYFNLEFLTHKDATVAFLQIKVIWGNSTGNKKRAGCIFGCNVLIESRWLQMQRPSAAGDTFLIFQSGLCCKCCSSCFLKL